MEVEENNIDDRDFGDIHFSWKFEEFPNHDRTVAWYFWGVPLVLIVVAISFWVGNILFGILAILVALIVLQFHRSDSEITFSISDAGILINKKFYPFKEIRNFYIIYTPPTVKTLYFEPRAWYSPRIPIYLSDQNPVEIRAKLLKHLEEDLDQEEEPLSDFFARIFKL